MIQTEPVIRVESLRMRYGSTDVLGGVDFTVGSGEVVALLGPNGAGKTTTIEILEGFRMRSGGDVSVFGTDPAGANEEWRAHVGVVLQSWRDHARWTPRRLLAHLGRYYQPFSEASRARPIDADELASIVGLRDNADQKIRTLSGGERRRLDVAVGIVGRPELLFLDEPTAGFDPQARRDFHGMIRRLADDEHTTILLTTHDLDEAERLADRILILAGDGSSLRAAPLSSPHSSPGRPGSGGASTASLTPRARGTPSASSASCSTDRRARSRTSTCAGRRWRTPTSHWYGDKRAVAAMTPRGGSRRRRHEREDQRPAGRT
jgi:ABC-type multidrug transport system ATPase subunit